MSPSHEVLSWAAIGAVVLVAVLSYGEGLVHRDRPWVGPWRVILNPFWNGQRDSTYHAAQVAALDPETQQALLSAMQQAAEDKAVGDLLAQTVQQHALRGGKIDRQFVLAMRELEEVAREEWRAINASANRT